LQAYNSKPFLVATWYRPPNSAVEIFTHFELLIGKLDADNLEYYLMGDMNCNLASSPLDNNANLLISVADVYGMQQLITDPTRCTELTSTLIDLIFTNSPERVVCSGVLHVSISDHYLCMPFVNYL
jgi:endonuclease/exonuclease/phosphatase family metal-dependent hydrolase